VTRHVNYGIARKSRMTGGDIAIVGFLGLGMIIWWNFLRGDTTIPDVALTAGPKPVLTTDRPDDGPAPPSRQDVPEKGDTPAPPHASDKPPVDPKQAASLVSAGKEALSRGDAITARSYLSEAFLLGLEPSQAAWVRAELTRIGQETVFSGHILDNDPLASRYLVKTGDTLGKIAKSFRIPDDLVAALNGIANKNSIREGQSLRVVQGPFHAVVHKRSYVMDVFLDNVLVKHFKVGLGADGSTPTGEWRVSTKLVNPTYYPPRGGQVVAADDPTNPLGERWIGLIGISGEAAGQERYGIHGTVEPDSIGKSVSLGCIRMYNEDVMQLYTYLIEKQSTVTVVND